MHYFTKKELKTFSIIDIYGIQNEVHPKKLGTKLETASPKMPIKKCLVSKASLPCFNTRIKT